MTEEANEARTGETPRPYVQPAALEAPAREDVGRYFPYPCAQLSEQAGVLESETAMDIKVSGQTCRVIERIYTDAQGTRIVARSATPAAYMTTYADCKARREGYTMADGLLAQYMYSETRHCLLMRAGETVYALETDAGKDALLKAAAYLTFE